MRALRTAAISLALAGGAAAIQPPPASASLCGAVGLVNGVAGKACSAVANGDKLLAAGKKLVTGHLGSAAKAVLSGGGGGGSRASTVIGLAAVGAWALGGAKGALAETANVIGKTTTPRLTTTWFSSAYWRMAGIGAVLTLPFLFAAAVQALIRSDISLLARAALGYLPLSLLAVSIAAPLAMLLLAACDQMSAIVSSAAAHSGTGFLNRLALRAGALIVVASSPFLAFLVGVLTAAGAIVLWAEMLMREVAIYIVVLMLPLAFAGMVWPARRVWAIRSAELLVALILSKFAIVAVLALGGAALAQASLTSPGAMLAGLVLVVLGAFAPWALVRLLPLAELASSAAGHLAGEFGRLKSSYEKADEATGRVEDWASSVSARMRRQAQESPAPMSDRTEPDGAAAEFEKLPTSDERGDEEIATEAARGELVAVGGEQNSVEHVTPDAGRGDEEHGTAGADHGRTTSAGVNGSGSGERLPGMPAQYQMGNNHWRELVFGPEGWSDEPPWPTAEHEPEEGRGDHDADRSRPGDLPEDYDPRPPEQDPGEGRL